MKKFKVYDLYEGVDCIGYADTLKEVKRIAKQQYNDTDGECSLWYAEIDPVTERFERTSLIFIALI